MTLDAMPRPKKSERVAKASVKGPSRGRTGGRSGAAGYHFQDLYVALQLAKLLMGDRDPLIEVLWEKKSLDLGGQQSANHVYVDDAVVRVRSGRCAYVQVKETSPRGGWTLREFADSGVALQFWTQWLSLSPEHQPRAVLRLASASDVTPLKMLVDAALRSRTPAELTADEASRETLDDLQTLGDAVSQPPDSQQLLAFVKSLQAEQLPDATELEGLIIRSLAPFGPQANDVAQRLIRIVTRSKNVGPDGRSSLDHDGLVFALREDGLSVDVLVGAGLVRSARVHDPEFWDGYRAEIVKAFRTFRVYGLHIDRAVFADLPSLFVPLRLGLIADRKRLREQEHSKQRERRSLSRALLADTERADSNEADVPGSVDLASVLREQRRFALIGGPGSGKTTTLRWLALVSALPGDEGSQLRQRFGLPAEPLLPLFVRFRRLADRIQARGLDGIAGRVWLVSEFLAAELESGLAGRTVGKTEALQIANELLSSDRCIFLFDALDEVPDARMRSRLFDAVADLMQRYPAPRLVMSSRPYAFQEDRAPLDLMLYEPLPMGRAAQKLFARQWYRAVRTHLGDTLSEPAADAKAEDLARAAEALADLSENPLLLSIIALVHFNQQGLPVERSTLYDHATLAMLGHWERDPAGRDLGEQVVTGESALPPKLQETLLRRVVEYLARDVQERDQGGGEFSEPIAVAALARGLEGAGVVAPDQAPSSARYLLRLLLDQSGIIQERSPGTLAFAHLSFQDYLAARWFVGAGDRGLFELAQLASEERHAEVVRFAVAILSADQRAEADERALRLVREVSGKDAVLAAACMLEAPRLQLGEEGLQQLARRVWGESAAMWRRHHHPAVASRLVWTILERSTHADDLLLEFLTLESSGHRRPMEGEMGVALLVGRPPLPISKRLAWLLQRMEAAVEKRSWMPFGSIAALLLVEGGFARPQQHVASLVRLLGDEHWNHAGRGTLADRAERILVSLASGPAREDVRTALEDALQPGDSDNDDQVACAAAKAVLTLGLAADGKPADVLIERGLRRSYRQSEVGKSLRGLMAEPRNREWILASLRRGLKSDNEEVMRGCARVLKDSGISEPTAEVLIDVNTSADKQGENLRLLLADPSQRESTLALLTETLWDEHDATAWRAATVLIEQGLTETTGVIHALVRVGLGSATLRRSAIAFLEQLRGGSGLDLSVRGALLDGLRNETDSVATTCAWMLTDFGEGRGDTRIARLTKALLRDPQQLPDALPRLRRLLERSAPPVVKTLGAFIGNDGVDKTIAAACAALMVETGHLDTPNLAKTLVLAGLADESSHDRFISYIKALLDDPQRVTDARKALSKGLESKDADVAWGSARCLWEVESRSDAHLSAAIIRAGLSSVPRRQLARAWLFELLRHPRTAAKTLPALEETASEMSSVYGAKQEHLDLAWEIATCLLQAEILDADHLPAALVRGGLSVLERHDEAVVALRELLKNPRAPVDAIETELWSSIERVSNSEVIAAGAARVLIEADFQSVRKLLTRTGYEDEKRAVALLKALVAPEDNVWASETVRRLTNDPECASKARRALAALLRDEHAEIAYRAAHCLVQLGDPKHRRLPAALVRGGLGHYERHEQTVRILDDLQSEPLVAAAVNEALQQALWGDDEGKASAAAAYLLDRGRRSDPGVARGLVFGAVSGHGPREHVDMRVWTLVADPTCRPSVVNALRALLLGEERGHMVNVASMLILFGEPLSERLLSEFDSDFAVRHSPFVPLAALALSGRVDEARDKARSIGLHRLLHLIGEDSFVGSPGFQAT